MNAAFISDDTLVRVGGMSGLVSGHIAGNRLKRNPDGSLSCTKGDPHAFYVDATVPEPRYLNPRSLLGLQSRGFQVMSGDTADKDMVWINPYWYPIPEATERGLI